MHRHASRFAMGMLCCLLAVGAAHADDWKALFNGKDLAGWQAVDGPMDSWKVDGEMLYTSGSGGGWLSTVEQYANFEIELQFRIPPGGNSGVFLRAPREGNPAFAGMEIQILDDEALEYAKLQPFQYCGSLYGIAAPKMRVSKKADEWQKMHIVCNGRRVKVTLNDTPIVNTNLDDHKDQQGPHPGINRSTGYVGLQNHGTRLDFRNIRLHVLP